jgi:DnaK suppressor protein
MDKENLEAFQKCLLIEQAQVTAELEQLERDSRENAEDQTQEGAWDSDVASDVSEEERILVERNHLLVHLREVNQALERIAQGTYGVSVVSGKPIPLERLEALPWATCLVGEQEKK